MNPTSNSRGAEFDGSLRSGIGSTVRSDLRKLWNVLPSWDERSHAREYWRSQLLYRRLLRDEYTMTSARRGRALYRLAADVSRRNVPGALVDCGVWNGGSTALLSAGAPQREAWAFDSFEGLPEPGLLDGADSDGWAGECVGSEARLREAFARFAHPDRLHVRKGWFQETFPKAAQEIGTVALLHCDGDWYDSVALTLETFYRKIPSGGYIVIDDYGHWIGARRATDDFREGVRDTAPLVKVDYTGRYWRKP